MAEITVFLARTVRTMEASLPVAEAVAVRDGRIVEVGTFETMRPWLESRSYEVDDTFRDQCIHAGVHRSPPASLHGRDAAAHALHDGGGVGSPGEMQIEPVHDQEQFRARLVDIEAEPGVRRTAVQRSAITPYGTATSTGAVLNEEYRQTVPSWCGTGDTTRLVVNDACLRWMDLDTAAAGSHPQIDLEAGRFGRDGPGGGVAPSPQLHPGDGPIPQRAGPDASGHPPWWPHYHRRRRLRFLRIRGGVGPSAGGDGTAGHAVPDTADGLHRGTGRRRAKRPSECPR